jgi:hypothetical protein
MDVLDQRARERQHIMQAINWLDKAIFALDKHDYNAAQVAITVSRKHIDEAEGMQHVCSD